VPLCMSAIGLAWPGKAAPASLAEWRRAVAHVRKGQRALAGRARAAVRSERSGDKTALEMLHSIGSHNSYHVGQVAQLRQVLGSWPPPSGGATW